MKQFSKSNFVFVISRQVLNNKLRYKGRFIPKNLEAQIRECHTKMWRSGKRVSYKKMLESYYTNVNLAREDLSNYKADPYCGIDELEDGLYLLYREFMPRLNDLITQFDIKTPKFHLKRWGDDFYMDVSRAELSVEKEDFLNKLWDAYADARKAGAQIDSPYWSFSVKILTLAQDVYVDFNDTQQIDDQMKPYLQ